MKNYSIILFAVLAIMSSCSNDKNSIKADDLNGNWVCKKATDNGEDSDLIPGAKITFKGNKLTFPILEEIGKAAEQEFLLKNDEIHFPKEKEFVFKIKELTDTKMTLQFSMEDHEVELLMEKTK